MANDIDRVVEIPSIDGFRRVIRVHGMVGNCELRERPGEVFCFWREGKEMRPLSEFEDEFVRAALGAGAQRLRDAATALYEAGHWHCDRPVDEAALWTELRDALGRKPGKSPKPLEYARVEFPGWISVADRMPPLDTECLVWARESWRGDDKFGIRIETYREQHEAPVSFSSATVPIGPGWDDHDHDEITHWMTLPSAPGEVSNVGDPK